MTRPRLRLADLFCGAGGAGMGYHMAGSDVVGFDIEPQPNYPFEFRQVDVLMLDPGALADEFDAAHASPPCQRFTRLERLHQDREYVNLIPPTRELLAATGLPYVIENVVGAPLRDPVQICGSALALRVRRHRMFECSFPAVGTCCQHEWQERHAPYRAHIGAGRGKVRRTGVVQVFGGNQHVGGQERFVKSVAMGIDWMTPPELNQAIPPSYTLHIGRQLLAHAVTGAKLRVPDREGGTGSLFRLEEAR